MQSKLKNAVAMALQFIGMLDLNHQLCYFPNMTPEQMKERLEKHYPGCKIEVFDLTGTQDHYEVFVESSIFSGMTRIQQHQHVMACFGPELKTGEVHALSIKTKIE